MTTDISSSVADRQRDRAARRAEKDAGRRGVAEPPRQKRPALAALALLLIVGGALTAGLLAIRMDTRVPVLVAATDIAPGTEITREHLETVNVASEGLDLISAEHIDTVVGSYANTAITAGRLLDVDMLSTDPAVTEATALVSLPLAPTRTPSEMLREGDLVCLTQTSGGAASEVKARAITAGVILTINEPSADALGAASEMSASALIDRDLAVEVLDAAGSDTLGLYILGRGQTVADFDPASVACGGESTP